MSELGIIAGQDAHVIGSEQTALARVCAYWASLRRDARIPRRSAINPKALGAALPHVFLAELVTPRVARLRICGHRIEDLLGMDMRGMPLSVLFAGPARQALAEAVEQAGHGARVTLSLQSTAGAGKPALVATLALLPLADDTGRITRLLGVLEYHGKIGHTPRSFALAEPVITAQPSAPVASRPVLRVIAGGRA